MANEGNVASNYSKKEWGINVPELIGLTRVWSKAREHEAHAKCQRVAHESD